MEEVPGEIRYSLAERLKDEDLNDDEGCRSRRLLGSF